MSARLVRARPTRLIRTALTALVLGSVLTQQGSAAALVDPGTSTSYELTSVVVPLVFPVATSAPTSYSDNFLACRSGCARMHMGQDLMGAKMTPLLAAFDGTVTSLKRERVPGEGNYLVITADRGPSRGWSAIYVHVNNDTPGTDDGLGTTAHAFPSGIEVGSRVLAGQLVGWRGDSGNSESTAPHLHFELRKTTPEGRSGWGGTVHNAYPSLRAARRIAIPLPSGPHPEGSLLRHPTGSLWILESGAKRAVTTTDLAAHGRIPEQALPMTAAESLQYPTGAPLPLRDGTLATDGSGAIWLVSAGTRMRVDSAQLQSLGYANPRVHTVSTPSLTRLTESAPPEPVTGAHTAQAVPALLPGTLVRAADSTRVHLVDSLGRLRWIPSTAVLASHGWSSRDVSVRTLPPLAPTWTDLGLRDATLVQQSSDNRVGVVSGGAFRPIRDARQRDSYGYTRRPRLLVSPTVTAPLRRAELSQP